MNIQDKTDSDTSAMQSDPRLDALRQGIDSVDREILACLNRRLSIAREIGEIKKDRGLELLDFAREKAVLENMCNKNPGPLPDKALRHIYAEIIAASRAIQQPLEVAYLGPEATFTHMASMNHFGHATNFVPQASIKDVFDEVEKKRCPFGVVPVENSMEGAVNHTLDLFYTTDVGICAEIYTPISHDLMARESGLSSLRVIYSHPQAFAQCRSWLRKNLPEVPHVQCASTSEAARLAGEIKGGSAIASSHAAQVYGLHALATNIQDSANNVTRFLVIGGQKVTPTGKDKTSLLFAVPHVPGALHKIPAPVAEAGINMMKLESRPAKNASWHYLFFLDLEGHMQEPAIEDVFRKMQGLCAFIKCLGSYPQADSGRTG